MVIKDNKDMVKSSVLVSLITAFSLVIGFLSQVLIAYYFGTSRDLDRFLIAYAFPSIFNGIGGAVFSSSLIPIVTPIMDSSEALKKTLSTAFFFTVVISFCIALFGFLGRAFILRVTTNLPQDDMILTVKLAGLVWLIAGVTILTSFVSSAYQLNKSFILPAMVFLLPTTGRILGTVIFANKLGIIGVILGEMVFCLLSLIVLLPIIFKYVSFPLRIEIDNPRAISFLKTMIPVSISLAPFTILPSIDAFWASGLPAGSMSYIGYSTRIVVVLSVLVVNGIYMVILPYLSEDIATDKGELFLSRVGNSIKAVLMFFVPIGAFCIFYRYQLIGMLFKRGMFTQSSVNEVASVLPFYLGGLLGMGPATLVSRAYHAKREFKKFGILSVAFIVMYFISAGVLSRYLSYKGIGIAYLAYWLLFFAISTLLLDKRIFSTEFFMHSLKAAFSAIVSVAISYFVLSKLAFLGVVTGLFLAFATTCMLFGLSCYILKIKQAVFVIQHVYSHWLGGVADVR
jgi:putative peptidoglycan lipid II flippase